MKKGNPCSAGKMLMNFTIFDFFLWIHQTKSQWIKITFSLHFSELVRKDMFLSQAHCSGFDSVSKQPHKNDFSWCHIDIYMFWLDIDDFNSWLNFEPGKYILEMMKTFAWVFFTSGWYWKREEERFFLALSNLLHPCINFQKRLLKAKGDKRDTSCGTAQQMCSTHCRLNHKINVFGFSPWHAI